MLLGNARAEIVVSWKRNVCGKATEDYFWTQDRTTLVLRISFFFKVLHTRMYIYICIFVYTHLYLHIYAYHISTCCTNRNWARQFVQVLSSSPRAIVRRAMSALLHTVMRSLKASWRRHLRHKNYMCSTDSIVVPLVCSTCSLSFPGKLETRCQGNAGMSANVYLKEEEPEYSDSHLA